MNDQKVKSIVVTAIFAAITFLGIQMFRIPMPAVVGTPFVHFGHIFVVLGMLMLGARRGAAAGTIGLVVFDLVNGYLQAMPQVFVETIVKCLLVGCIFAVMKQKADGDRKKETAAVMICSVIYAVLNIVIEFVMGIVNMMLVGSGFAAAAAGSLSSIPATVINAVFMVIGVSLLYWPVKRIYVKAFK